MVTAERVACAVGSSGTNALLESFIARLRRNPFIHACRSGAIGLPNLRAFLVQHAHYNQYFTRYLCALISNLKDIAEVEALATNLAEELGLSQEAARGEPHSKIYRRMLRAMGLDVGSSPMLPETRALVDKMFEHCRNPEPAYGLGALGLGAEAIVPHLYGDIVQGFRSRGIGDQHLEFFHLHIGCDDAHAKTMADMIERIVAIAPEFESKVALAATQVFDARLALFSRLMRV